jgi:hypothetical protein
VSPALGPKLTNNTVQNINHARMLLTKMEQDALGIKIHARRQELQIDLSSKREVLEQLMDRMLDLEEMGAAEDEDSSDGEDILGEIVATPSESLDSVATSNAPPEEPDDEPEVEQRECSESARDVGEPLDVPKRPEAAAPAPPVQEKPELRTETTQTLRSRGREPEKEKDTAVSTSTTSKRAALFGDRTGKSISQTATSEAILDHQRAEQDFLYESISKMASSLKASSQAFAASLEEDKDVLGRAGEGLDRNERGLEAASKRMGTLQKMAEGKGWWGRMMLYAWIYGLMVVLVLLVFVGPKLRFSTW